jgi:hypothetical protein
MLTPIFHNHGGGPIHTNQAGQHVVAHPQVSQTSQQQVAPDQIICLPEVYETREQTITTPTAIYQVFKHKDMIVGALAIPEPRLTMCPQALCFSPGIKPPVHEQAEELSKG